jgi:hypothetical protein
MESCTSAPFTFGFSWPLQERYEKFTKTKTDKLVLAEIKNNLI